MMSLRNHLPFLFAFVLCLYVTCGSMAEVRGQSATASINVLVVDANSAAVRAVNITLSNVSTGVRREATTNNAGQAGITQLSPGRYTIVARKQGFEAAELDNVSLAVNDIRTVRLPLKVAEIKASVQVTDGGSTFNESSAVSTVVNHQFVENLPLNGRSFNALIELTPGAVLTRAQYSEPGQYSVNGQRQNANYFMVDGVSANVGISGGSSLEGTSNGAVPALTAFGGTNGLVSEDAMQEFRIQTSTYAPEFGRSPGAQVSIITRGGANQFHGTAFEYLRNEALDANDWFANSFGLPKAKLRQNDFGGVFSGPLRRNSTFFFFSYEGLRLFLPNFYNSTVPSLSARQAAIPATKPLLNAFPIPNGADFGNGLAQFVANDSSPTSLNATSIRIDHVVNNRVSLFGRYNYAPSYTSLRGAFVGGSVSQSSRGPSVPSTLTIGTQLITTRITNDLRFNYSRVRRAIEYLMDDFGGAVPPSTSSITHSSADQSTSLYFVTFGPASALLGELANNYQRQINIVDNVATAIGTHQLGFGVDYRRLTPISGVHPYEFNAFFNGINAAVAGLASRVVIVSNFGRVYPVFNNFSAYVQDTWRVNRKLTMTYGVRWELNPPPHEANGNDPFTVQGLDQPATMTLASHGTPLWDTTYGNFAPRFGATFLLNDRPGWESILRGGLGVFYDMGNGPGAQAIFGANYPHSASKVLTNVQLPLTDAQLAPLAFSTSPPYPTLYVADPHLVLPRTYQWNVSSEQALGHAQAVSVSYVAAAGRRLLRKELLRPNALFGDVYVNRNLASSDYHSLQIQFQRRLVRGFQAMASYTWSHSIDNASTESLYSIPGAKLDPDIDRGNSDFDVRHSFSAATTYDLPSPEDNRFLGALFGHWSVDSILRMHTAPPVWVTERPFLNPLFGVIGLTRPNVIEGVPLYLYDKSYPGGKRINPAAFINSTADRQGSLGRNVLRGFPVSQLDLAVRRKFALGEGIDLHIRAEFFNAFNHPNFGPPVDVFGRPAFGLSQSMLNQSLGFDNTGLNPRYQLGGPRSIQFAAKIQF